jgi:NTP pyrophosphatase (non-canonical NTP hydrolase)
MRRPTLSLRTITEISVLRCNRWHHHDTVPWVGADWSNAMAGECGEACNAVKKLRRLETMTMGAHNGGETDRETLVAKLAEELADTFLYGVLVAAYYDIDLTAAIVEKFNLVSEESAFPERLSVSEPRRRRFRKARPTRLGIFA